MVEHTRKQLKYVATGGMITWFTAVFSQLRELLRDAKGSARVFTSLSVLLGITTILLFLYLVFLPRVRGVNPNYSSWRDSPELAVVIPILTTSIVVGWSSLVFTLSTWSSLGTIWSIVGSGGLYALCFGLIGLIPVPDR
ncbi:hypothetical protein JB92DRAFT_2734775 [Gautieria morchelliformis]|nr:hypothetical protein JB92DRAFT_2734775 [Gautieria morchelliformis]